MKAYIRLIRPKHYIKNGLILIPLFFNKSVFDSDKLKDAIVGIVVFSLVCSAIYILNDLMDLERDRQHPTKCKRPIAGGDVSTKSAKYMFGICLLGAWLTNFVSRGGMKVHSAELNGR